MSKGILCSPVQLRTSLVALGMAFGVGAAFAQSTTTLPQTLLSSVASAADKGATSTSQLVTFTVSLKSSNQAGLEAFVDSVSSPTSANYGHFLTPAEVGQKFGATATDQAAVVSFLQSKGLTVTLINSNRLAITAQGTVGQVQSAFGIKIHNYSIAAPDGTGTWTFRSNQTALKVPTTISSKILDISGIETYSRSKKKANTSTLTPPLVHGLYNTLPMYNALFRGQGRTVGISNFDGFRLADAQSFINLFSLPTPAGGALSNVSIVTIAGGSGSGTPSGEGDLDIQMVLGAAPLSTIIIYDSASDLATTLSKESSDNKADIISESYGWNLSPSGATACHNLHLAMAAQGITYMEATGDNGTTLEPFSYSNYDPEVFQVGGTVATVNSTTGARVSEVGWSGSGGGWATSGVPWNTLASWQKGPGVPTNILKRLNPDVALHADDGSGFFKGYIIFVNGAQTTESGTSASSPTFAGCLAVAEQKLISLGHLPTIGGKMRFGRIQDLIYSQVGRSDVYFDVTSGSNGTLPNGQPSNCTAKWDFVTGWGAFDFNGFVNSLNTSSATTVAPNGVTPVQGDQVGGDLSSLATSNNNYYSMESWLIDTSGSQANGTLPATAQAASFSTDFQLDTSAGTLFDLKVLVEANATSTGVAGQVFGYNWNTGGYELITSFSLSTSDKANTLNIPSTSFGKFVDGSGNVRLLFRGINSIKPGRPTAIPSSFTMNFDQIVLQPTFSS